MTIELNRTLDDYLADITPCKTFEIQVPDEKVFADDFIKNPVLNEIVSSLSTIAPASIGQVLCLGGYQLSEAGMNIKLHGKPGETHLTLHAAEGAVVYVLISAGEGFDYRETYHRFCSKDIYWHHKGHGFRCFERPHVSVSFDDSGRTTIIRSGKQAEEAYIDFFLDIPRGDKLGNMSLFQALNHGSESVRRQADQLLMETASANRQSGVVESPVWGFNDMVQRVRERNSVRILRPGT